MIFLEEVIPQSLKNATFGKSRFKINDSVKHDLRNLLNPSYGMFLITSTFKICKKKKRFFQTAKVDVPLNKVKFLIFCILVNKKNDNCTVLTDRGCKLPPPLYHIIEQE